VVARGGGRKDEVEKKLSGNFGGGENEASRKVVFTGLEKERHWGRVMSGQDRPNEGPEKISGRFPKVLQRFEPLGEGSLKRSVGGVMRLGSHFQQKNIWRKNPQGGGKPTKAKSEEKKKTCTRGGTVGGKKPGGEER